ncbi:hypothetical protein HMPREF3180_02185 [Leptotrichia wadei]|uniref:Uncharacterized protein n=1 Tax=Leptotrichia wadei TaxID=157687 RepID=A0A133ZWX8_9FUSO|nr:hypothetical protein HMPREF3180_02185 [Leptotrichia wadei]
MHDNFFKYANLRNYGDRLVNSLPEKGNYFQQSRDFGVTGVLGK